jgi:malate synthase
MAAAQRRTTEAEGVEILSPVSPEFAEILTPRALGLVASLHRAFDGRRRELLERRVQVQAELDRGWLPDFLSETKAIREGEWTVGPTPPDLMDRRVEITGPVDRKMVINALNSGARMYMADLEDSHSPTWDATIEGQINLRDAVRGTITYASHEGKSYTLGKQLATLLMRPRGWHLHEKHVNVDGRFVSASLFDFALFLYHNAQALLDKGTGPYFYLPKMESHLEARLWNDVFVRAQEDLSLPVGTVKATVLIETILAAFEMHEILWELRDHIVGLNCGRWDYIFSFIKKFRSRGEFVLPDRARVTMTTHNMRSYSLLAIQTCHRRSAHAMGGMAAQIPIKGDPAANEAALQKVREDKEREAGDGHDGTWVAHPGLVQIALEAFDAKMPGPHQRHRLREDVTVSAADLLAVPSGAITEGGLRVNINVGLRYLESWLRGSGCVPIFNLMEDAATCEISRTQIWQWIKHERGMLDDSRKVTAALVGSIMSEELEKIRADLGPEAFDRGKFDLARKIFEVVAVAEPLADFLTLPAYEYLP